MNNPHRNIPEPRLAEHDLIRESAPMPELSAGFKSRVLAECSTSIASARRTYRLKVAGSMAAVCCLCLLFCLKPPQTHDSQPVIATEAEKQELRPSSDPSGLPNPSGLTVDSVRPVGRKESDGSQINEIIEDLSNRQQMFNANMIPRF